MDTHILISVGRQFGSGGLGVARELGKRLGIPVYDNELIAKAAEASGFSRSLFERSDERRRVLSIGNIFGVNRYSYAAGTMNDSELFRIQSEVIRDIASKGSAIFVGRASDYVLRDMKCLDIFICAPIAERAARVSEREGISTEEAEALIMKRDKGRAQYYNFFTFGDWGVASNYDLCLDSSILGIEGTADFVIAFGRKADLF